MIDGSALLAAIVRGALAAGTWHEKRQANLLDGGAPFYRTYRTSDGEFVAVGALEPQFFAALLAGLGLEPEQMPGQYDRSQWSAMQETLADVIDHSRGSIGKRFSRGQMPACPRFCRSGNPSLTRMSGPGTLFSKWRE